MYTLPNTQEEIGKDPREMLAWAMAADEPVFIIRAQDLLSTPLIEYYLQLFRQRAPSTPYLEHDIELTLDAFRKWQVQNHARVKFAD